MSRLLRQSTGASIFPEYATTDGLLAEVKVGERNVLGTGRPSAPPRATASFARAGRPCLLRSRIFSAHVSAGSSFTANRLLRPYQSPTAAHLRATCGGLARADRTAWRAVPVLALEPESRSIRRYARAAASLPLHQAPLAGPAGVSSSASHRHVHTLDSPQARPADSNRHSARISPAFAHVDFLRTTEDLVTITHPDQLDVVQPGCARKEVTNHRFGAASRCAADEASSAPDHGCGICPTDSVASTSPTPGNDHGYVGVRMYWQPQGICKAPSPRRAAGIRSEGTLFVDAGSVFHYDGGPTTFPGSTPSFTAC